MIECKKYTGGAGSNPNAHMSSHFYPESASDLAALDAAVILKAAAGGPVYRAENPRRDGVVISASRTDHSFGRPEYGGVDPLYRSVQAEFKRRGIVVRVARGVNQREDGYYRPL